MSENADAMNALTLRMQDEMFAIEAGSVREILDLVPITVVPKRAAVRHRAHQCARAGRAARRPAGDVRHGSPATRPGHADRGGGTEIENEPTVVGILADKVYDVTDIEAADIQEAPKVGMRWRPDFIRGIGRRNGQFVVIPDLARIFDANIRLGRRIRRRRARPALVTQS